MCVADNKIGQLIKNANIKQISYITVFGVHSIMHFMHTM